MERGELILLKTRYDHHFSASTIVEFEETFVEHFKCRERPQQPFRKILKQIYRLSDRSDTSRRMADKLFSLISAKKNYFIVLMGIEQIRKAYPYFLFSAVSKSMYLFDCWENKFELVEETIERHHIQTIFFSAKQSADYFQKKFTNKNCIWVPEALNINNYSFFPPEQKTIDVLQFGRKYDDYHQKIALFCEQNNINYIYETVKGRVIFPDQKTFCKALAQCKISVCFPSNVTHPERSGNISTMTVRYLQSMASKCLVVGSLPEDMKLLFDYSPIVEVDMNNPAKQLKNILSNYVDYLPLIEKNYNEIHSKHQWVNRMEIFKKYIGN